MWAEADIEKIHHIGTQFWGQKDSTLKICLRTSQPFIKKLYTVLALVF